MIDPANLWGRVFALSRPDGSRVSAPRLPQNWLVFRQGRPRLLAEGYGRELTPLAGWEDVDLPGVIAALQSLMERPISDETGASSRDHDLERKPRARQRRLRAARRGRLQRRRMRACRGTAIRVRAREMTAR